LNPSIEVRLVNEIDNNVLPRFKNLKIFSFDFEKEILGFLKPINAEKV